MKNIFIISFYLICNLYFSQSGKLVVSYSFYESYKNNITLNSVLKINQTQSIFVVDDNMITDKTETGFDKDDNQLIKSYRKSKENRTVYKNYNDATILTLQSGYNPSSFYYIKESFPIFNWKVEKDTKEILGYNCQKATTSFRGEII
nr:GLPGLI family protein [Elizabethkingia anophelis]